MCKRIRFYPLNLILYMNVRFHQTFLIPFVFFLFLFSAFTSLQAADPGLPFTEDFVNINLKDETKTNATWSPGEQEVYLAWQKQIYGALSDPAVWDIDSDTNDTYAIALGDVDGDGDLDVVAGNSGKTNKLYLNNGSEIPFFQVTGTAIGSDTDYTRSVALCDIDRDGDLDVVAGNSGINKLYLNNGTENPFDGVSSTAIGLDTDSTRAIALGDVDSDGDLDVVAGNRSQTNKLYLNNGTANPFNGVSGTDIGSDTDETPAISLGDVDGDGDLDVVAGNSYSTRINKLYLNNGTENPFNGVSGTDIGSETDQTNAIALGDMDRDGDLDVIASGYGSSNKLYLNNGTANPFNGVSGTAIGNYKYTSSIALGDVDGDGDLDVVAGNDATNTLYLNNGTENPFDGVSVTDINSNADYTFGIALGDVDGDGDLDVVAGNWGQTNKLYLNNGTGNPLNGISGSNIGSDTSGTATIALGDVDGDGDIDVVVGDLNQTNKLYLNNGDGTFAASTPIGSDTDYTWAITLGDVDGDGDLDVVAGNKGQTNKVYLNNGDGIFAASTPIGSDTDEIYAIALGDVDGDGDLDVVAGNYRQTNKVYLNNGDGTFAASTPIGSDTDETTAIALGDVDGDGDLDVVAGNDAFHGGDDWRNKLYLNNGTENPFDGVSGTAIGSDTDRTWAIALGDVNGDGDLDVVVGNHAKTNKLYLNNGTENPFNGVIGTNIGLVTSNTETIALGDVDGDGDLDVVAGLDDQANRLYLNNGAADPFNGVISTHIGSDLTDTWAIALGDVDRDGDLDLVAGNIDQPNILYLNNSTRSPFTDVSDTNIGLEEDSSYAISLGDVDGDGDIDVAVGNYYEPSTLYLNNGTTNPFNGVNSSDIGTDSYTRAIALGDVDGDGGLDAVVGHNGLINKLYLNNGTMDPFDGVSGMAIGSDMDNSLAIALGDMNGDGYLDVVTGNSAQTNKLYLNDKAGDPFDTVTGTNLGTNTNTRAIALGDVDGNGSLDVVAGNYGTNTLYLNNGDGTFLTGSNFGLPAGNTLAIALGDMNGDGHLDVVVGNDGQENMLYLNNGTMDPFNGVSGTAIGSDTDNHHDIALGDVDGDGDLDVVAGNYGQADTLYLNNGDSTFAAGQNFVLNTSQTRAIALGDVDGNGDLDVVAGNDGQTNTLYRRTLYYNTGHDRVTSIEVDTESIDNISHATLTSSAILPLHTQIHYYLSNNGGNRFFEVYPSREFIFPTQGNDLRWKTELHSKSPILTPRLSQIHVESRNIAPQATAGGTLAYTEDDPPTPIDATITVTDANNVNLVSATIAISAGYQNDQYGEDILGFINANGITGSWNAGTLTLSGSSSLANYQTALRSVTYQCTNTGNPTDASRTISFVVNDGELDSTPVTSTVTVTRTNDAPQIIDHDPNPAQIVQSEPVIMSINIEPAPAGHLHLTVDDPDNTQQDLSLMIQSGDNYLIQGDTITPIENFFGDLIVPLVVFDGEDYGDTFMLDIQVDDITNPWVSSVVVFAGGKSADITFSEPMGASVNTASNYTLSGSGRGTLSDNPDSVLHINNNNYRLNWNTGEMTNDGDVTITVSGVLDAAGNPMGSPPSSTHVSGGIGTAPVTGIDNGEGTYQSSVVVTLSCSDTGGSGCDTTYYSIDGSTPSIVYTNPITIDQGTTLRYFSEDAAGNQESVKTDIYTIEIPTTISCNLSNSNLLFGESFAISGTISPAPNQANQGVGIVLRPPVGDPALLSTYAASDGTFSIDVDCEELTVAGSWNISTNWSGDESHLSATSTQTPLTVTQAGSSLSLDVVASESIKVNSRPPIGGDFSPIPLCSSMDLSGTVIDIIATEPDGVTVHTLSATTNQYGQFLLDFDTDEAGQPFDFDEVGEWTISAAFAGSTEFASSDTDHVIIRVVPTAGYAIVVQGRVQSGEGMPSHHKTTSFVYDKLKDRQLLDDDIQYLSWLYSDGWDGDPSKSNIQDALTVWARDKMDPDFVHPVAELDTQGQAGDLYIIMIDHGWTDPVDDEEGIFYIYPDEPLTSTELGGWISELQSNLLGTVSEDRNIVVVLGFCRAGAFIDDLTDPAFENRVVVASAAKNESSHRGPQDVDENGQPLRDGEYFVSEFFKSVSYGKSIKQCFEDATLLTESFTSSGSGVTNAPFYDDSIQHPLLNDNGDAIGSNELSSVTGEDGSISEFLYIGASPPEGNDPGDVLITQVNSARFLGTTDTTVDLWAEVDDPNDLRLIWLEIKTPNYNPVDPGAGLQIEMDNFKKATTDVTGSRYAWNSVGNSPDPTDLFDIPGTYQIFYFSKDDDTGHVSPLVQSKVYKALEGNTIPNEFNLLIPADTESVLTTTILDWEDAIDPDGDSLTYSVLLSKNDDQFTDPILIEGLSNSEVLINPEDGIQDLSTYYWKVRAIDEYGAYRETSVRMFETDNTNPVIGFIKGFIYDATTDEAITSATININNGSLILNSSLNGHYLGSFEPGNFPITITAGGYQDIQSTLDMPEGITVTMNFGLTPSIVDTDPIATISSPATSISILKDGSVNFQSSILNGNAPFTYIWDFDGGAVNSTLEDPGNILFDTAGNYTVQFTVTDSDGDIDSDTVQVIVTLGDNCPEDPNKTDPGICGCGVADIDTDDDTILDCIDTDDDDDGILDIDDDFPLDDTETLDTDNDGTGNNADTDDDNDGISDAIEAAGPNSGDANNDGTQDSLQDNVACVEPYTSQGYVVLETPPGITLANCQAANNPSPGDAPADMNFDYGFFDFTISGITPGGSTTLTMTLPSGVTPDTYYKYGQTQANQTDHWYEFLYDTQTGTEINGNVITLNFVDALRGDDVLTQDSMVIDLGAPGFDATAVDLEPTATITSPASNTTITAGGSVNFQGSVTSGNSPFTYSWTFDGGAANVNSEDPGNVTFSTAGTYTVTFTVTDADNDTDSDTVTITVNAPDDGGNDGGGGGGGGGGGCFVDILN